MDPIERHLGRRLKKLRMDRGLSEIMLDSMARLPVGTCRLLERGTAFFGPSQLHALARSLDVDPAFFFDGLPLDDAATDPALTKEARDLVKAFHHIEDPGLRRKIIGLVKAVAD